jgi:hypothetical protein
MKDTFLGLLENLADRRGVEVGCFFGVRDNSVFEDRLKILRGGLDLSSSFSEDSGCSSELSVAIDRGEPSGAGANLVDRRGFGATCLRGMSKASEDEAFRVL